MAFYATKNREEALEIVQDSMYKLVQKYSKRSAEEWPPLFTRIVQNRIKNWYRRQAVNRTLFGWLDRDEALADSDEASGLQGAPDVDPPNDGYNAGFAAPDKKRHSDHFLEALEQALKGLPARQQQVFLLRAVQGYDVAETAAAMQCSAGSVKTHYSRALRKLQDRLGEFAL